MKVYYAHCTHLYGTEQERRDIATLEAMGFEVVNPNSKGGEDKYKEDGINAFRSFVQSCDILAFRACPDTRITSGVFKETCWAMDVDMPVIELPSNFLSRGMSIGETRQYLRECGAR